MRAEGFRLFDLAFGGILYMYMYMCMCMYMYMYMFMYMYMDMDADLDMYMYMYMYMYTCGWTIQGYWYQFSGPPPYSVPWFFGCRNS